MSRLILFALITTSLLGCASKPIYVPARDSESIGYYETRLTETRYRVTFNGTVYTPEEKVKNYALLRAAQLTVANSYDWFKIVDRDQMPESTANKPKVTVSVGVGRGRYPRCYPYGCWIVDSPYYTGIGLHTIDFDDRRQSIIEIVMGKGEPEEPTSVYNASELIKYLGRETLLQ